VYQLLLLLGCRLLKPLPESAVLRLAELYDQHHLLEHYRAANRKCLDEQQQRQA
jgi:hypothetical protein